MVKATKSKGAQGTGKEPKGRSVVKAQKQKAEASDFSQEAMLKNIKKFVKSVGGDIMKAATEQKDIKSLLESEEGIIDLLGIDAAPSENAPKTKKHETTQEDTAVVVPVPASRKPRKSPKSKTDDTEVASPEAKEPHEKISANEKTKDSKIKLLFSNVEGAEDSFKRLLQNQVSSCGPYLRCSLGKNGKGIVIVENEAVAKMYLSHFNGYELDGKQISVAIAAAPQGRRGAPVESSEQYKSVTISGIPNKYGKEAIVTALRAIEGVTYASLEKADGDKWKVTFETVPECVKFNSLVNGCSLNLVHDGKTKSVKVKCESASFGKKAAHSGRVFVQNLPFKVEPSKLEALVKRFDKNAKVNLPGGNKKGFAFVQFSNLQVAEKVILKLNGTLFGGRKIRMALSLPSEIYGAKAKSEEPKEDEQDETKAQDGGDDNEEPDPDTELYSSETLNGGRMTTSDDGRTSLKADALPSAGVRSDKSTESQRTIFVRNLSFESTEEALKEYFSGYGAVESCKICRDEKGVSKGTAFVLFANVEDAKKVLSMEDLALKRDADFGAGELKDNRARVKHSAIAGIGFSLNGRRLKLSLAVSKEHASTLAKSSTNKKQEQGNKKGENLLMEGVIEEKSPEFLKLSEREQKIQIASLKEKMEKMKNPNMFINPKRICVRNLPPTADVNKLRTAIATHFRQNANLSGICGTDKVKATRAIGKVTFLSDDKRKVQVGDSLMRRRMPFAFIDFAQHELALEAVRFLSNNSELYGPRYRLFAEFAIEDSRALYIQKKRKEQYMEKLKESGKSTTGEKRKRKKTYSRGKLQRMKRRKLQEAASKDVTSH